MIKQVCMLGNSFDVLMCFPDVLVSGINIASCPENLEWIHHWLTCWNPALVTPVTAVCWANSREIHWCHNFHSSHQHLSSLLYHLGGLLCTVFPIHTQPGRFKLLGDLATTVPGNWPQGGLAGQCCTVSCSDSCCCKITVFTSYKSQMYL